MALSAIYQSAANVAINGSAYDHVSDANLTVTGTLTAGTDAAGDFLSSAGSGNYVALGNMPRFTQSTGGTLLIKFLLGGRTDSRYMYGELEDATTSYHESINSNHTGVSNSPGSVGFVLKGESKGAIIDIAGQSLNNGVARTVGIEWTKGAVAQFKIYVDGSDVTSSCNITMTTDPDPASGTSTYPFVLFGRNLRGTASGSFIGKIYTFARLSDSGFDLAALTANPNILFAGADVTAPTLTSATATATSDTTASGSVTTDEGNGTLYSVATASATVPSQAQVKAGQDHTGSAAVWDASQAISSTGAKSVSLTGLTAETTYYLHHMHEDLSANQSDVESSASFTTDAAPSVTNAIIVTDAIKNNTGTLLASQSGIKVAVLKSEDLASVYEGSATTNASGVLSNIVDAAITVGQSYHVAIKLTDGSVGITGAIEAV